MKKIITLVLTTCIFYSANAQQFSAGVRTGASKWMDKKEGKCFSSSGQNTTWDKEMFVRYNTKGKFAFEAGMGHYAFSNQVTRTDYGCVYDANANIAAMYAHDVYEKSQNLEWNLSAQYDLSCPALQEKCPLMKNLKSYVGVVVSPTLSRYTTTSYSVEGNYTNKNSRDEWSLWTGLTHSLVYKIDSRLYLSSTMRMQIDPANFFSKQPAGSSVRDSRLGMQIGVGYAL
ncbi:MAG TPA: hypothetical protein PL009_07890 [Flavipsychrobacter sp.]|nr:hypothetical protein [Flavipsychrobacter sp.]